MVRITHIGGKVKGDIQIVNIGMYYTYMYNFDHAAVFEGLVFMDNTTNLLFQTIRSIYFCVNSQNNHNFRIVHKLFSNSGKYYGIIMLLVS